MPIEDYPLYEDWSDAWDRLVEANAQYGKALRRGAAPALLQAAKSKLERAAAEYEKIVAKLD